MFVIAVTGTNGKTTTVELARQLLSLEGYKPASLGTLGVTSEDFSDSEPVLLGKQAVKELITDLQDYYKINMFLFEAFSDSLISKLYDNVSVDMALLTNIADDHLDYHKTKKNYIDAKMHLFTQVLKPGGIAIYNSDDDLAEKIRLIGKERNLELFSYGFTKNADLRILQIRREGLKSEVTLVYDDISYMAELPFIGDCFVLNWVGTLAIALKMDISIETLFRNTKILELPPGRLECIGSYNQARIFLDYAHNANALQAVLKTIRSTTKGRLHLVFGCGGDRDKSKRSEMGRVAQELAGKVIITDDNPRKETPAKIRKEIQEKCPKAVNIADRREAIEYALGCLKPADVLLITGKGSEEYQEISGIRIKHCDKETVSNFLNPSRPNVNKEKQLLI